MADPQTPTITLTMTPEGPLEAPGTIADGYAQVQKDALDREVLSSEVLNGESGPAEPQPVEKPSALAVAAQSAFQAAGEGARNTMEGLSKLLLPSTGVASVEDAGGFLKGKVEAVRQALLDGLAGVALSPLVGLGAGARQALENQNPELANAVALEPLQASFVRMMMGGGNPLKEGKQAEINQPMTVGEALDLAVQSAPMAGPALKKVGGAVKEQAPNLKGERGSIGPESRLNVERIQATDRVKAAMTEVNKMVGEQLAEHRRPVTHAATIEAGRVYTLQDALAANPEKVSLAEGRALQQSIRDYHVAVGTKLDAMEQAREPGQPLPPEYVDLFAMQVQLAKNNELFQAAHARGLEALKIMSDAERVRLSRRSTAQTLQIADLLRESAENPEGLADALALLRSQLDGAQQRSWQNQWYQGARAGKDLLYSAWVQALLSGPRTHIKNVIGNVSVFAFEAPEHFLAEVIGQLHDDPRGRMAFGETALALKGSIVSMRDGVRLAADAWRANEPPFEKAAMERSTVEVRIASQGRKLTEGKVGRTALGAEAYGFDPQTLPGSAIEVLAKALNSRYTPGGALIVEDAFSKGMAYHMQIDALALREAHRTAAPNATAVDIERSYRDFKANPTGGMVIEAQDQAILLTLNKELGPRGQAFVTLLDSVPGARVIVPFVRWSTNAAKWFSQRAPILAEMSAQNWSDIGEGGVLRDKAIARMVIGHAVAGAVAYEVMQGNITGGSNNKQERALKPFKEGPDYSIRVGDNWLAGYHQWLGAPGQMIAAVADYVDILRLIPNQRYFDEWAAKLEGLVLATGNIFVHQTAMQGVGNVFDAIQDPQRSAGKELQSMARSLVPTLLRDVTRAGDQNVIREARSIGDAVRAGLPWSVEGLAPFRHPVTGEDRQYPPGIGSEMVWPFGFFASMSSPLGFTKKVDEPWAKEVIANRISLPEVGWWINGSNPRPDEPHMTEVPPSAGVEISPWERDFWITQMTQVQKDGAGRTLPEALNYAMRPGSRYWNQSPGPEGGRSIEIKAIYNAFKAKGYAALINPAVGSPTLKARVLAQLEARMKAKLPVTDPRSPFAAATGR